MKEVILCKYGEIILKGANRATFESSLVKELRRRASPLGTFKIYFRQSTIYIEPQDDFSDMDAMYNTARHAFGIVGVTRCAVCEKNMDSILATVRAYLPEKLEGKRTFKVEAKRADKSFPFTSPEICREIGGQILDAFSHLTVDVHQPDLVVHVEIRDFGAYVHAPQLPGAGGMPVGTGGKAAILISGGIDSPVAAYMMAKRGIELTGIHFASPPYTSERAEQKVIDLLKQVSLYAGHIPLCIVPFTHIQEEIRDKCPEEYFTLVMRRFMMRIACLVAEKENCGALITGESVGQVASQTIPALACTDAVATLPVFRPVIGMDKEEIIQISRRIGAYDTSILPFEDCCTVFTPRHPRTRPELDKVIEEEKKLDFNALVEEAYATRYAVVVRQFGDNKIEGEN
jgi:thiamine biosynthesis protein ThiI